MSSGILQAVKYIEYDSSFSEEEKKQAKALKVACNLNDAACKLKLKEYKEAEKHCTKVRYLILGCTSLNNDLLVEFAVLMSCYLC